MAYISTEKTKEIRNELKVLYPSKDGWKLSVTNHDYSSLSVSILEAPFELRDDIKRNYEQVNQYCTEERSNQAAIEVLKKVIEISNKTNYNKSDSMSDYHDVGYYFNLSIGAWDKPFIVNTKN